MKTFNEVVKSFRQFLTVLEAAKWINLYFRKKFPLATPLMVSFFFVRKKTICFISLDKASAKSNDCWNSFDALLGLTPLRFNKLCTVFRFDVLRVTFSCFLSTAFFFYFLCCTRILNFVCVFFFKSLILSFSIALFFCKFYRYVGVFFSEKTFLFLESLYQRWEGWETQQRLAVSKDESITFLTEFRCF